LEESISFISNTVDEINALLELSFFCGFFFCLLGVEGYQECETRKVEALEGYEAG